MGSEGENEWVVGSVTTNVSLVSNLDRNLAALPRNNFFSVQFTDSAWNNVVKLCRSISAGKVPRSLGLP